MQDYAPDAAAKAGASPNHAGASWVLHMAPHGLPQHATLLAILAAARSPQAVAPANKPASGNRGTDGFQAERMAGHCASG